MKWILYNISRLFPDVDEIHVSVTETNAWPWNRLKEFALTGDMDCDFHLECPMSKCIGKGRGISYKDVVSDMVVKHDRYRQVRLNCVGYGGYNLTFHCDWYAVLDISITYRTP